jgi:multidrug efflux pump subunit AcrB
MHDCRRDPRHAADLSGSRRLHRDDHAGVPAADHDRRQLGLFIRVLPIAVFATVAASLLIALTIIPFLASRAAERARAAGRQSRVAVADRHDSPLLSAARTQSAGSSAHRGVGLASCVPGRHRRHWQGHRLQPVSKGRYAPLPDHRRDAGRQQSCGDDRALQFVEGKLRETPQVQSFFTNLGHGNPLIYYNVASHDGDISYGDLFVKLRHYDPRTTPLLLERLRDQFEEYPNARIYVREFSNGPAISAPIAIRVIGPDLAGTASSRGRRGEDSARDAWHARRAESRAECAGRT